MALGIDSGEDRLVAMALGLQMVAVVIITGTTTTRIKSVSVSTKEPLDCCYVIKHRFDFTLSIV